MKTDCANCGKQIEDDDGIWYHVDSMEAFCEPESPDLTRQAEPLGHLKVVVSFYVPTINDVRLPEDAEAHVRDVLARYRAVAEEIGDPDVHEGETIYWDMEG